MNKQLNYSRTTRYGGRNGRANMTGIHLFTGLGGDTVELFPINSRGTMNTSNKTFYQIPKEDIPALIDLLREAIGQTSDPATHQNTYIVTTCTDDCIATSIMTSESAIPEHLIGRHTETSIESDGIQEEVSEIMCRAGLTYDLGYSCLDCIIIAKHPTGATITTPYPTNIADKEFEESFPGPEEWLKNYLESIGLM